MDKQSYNEKLEQAGVDKAWRLPQSVMEKVIDKCIKTGAITLATTFAG